MAVLPMFSNRPPRLDPRPGHVPRLTRGLLGVALLFAVAFVLTGPNPNAGIFLVVAIVCVGLVTVSLFVRGVERFNRNAVLRTARPERDLVVGGLLLVALLTPWSIALPTLLWPQIFGWQSPLAVLILGALVLVRIPALRRHAIPAVAVAGLALLGWAGWESAQLLTPAFRASRFPFLPIDLIGEGWYIGLLAFAVTVDGMAVEASATERPAQPGEVWPFAVVPGAGLVRMRYSGRGRLWLLAVAVCVFLIQAHAVNPTEFQYYGAFGSLPDPRPRGAVLIPVALAVVIWLGSLWDTHNKLRLERVEGSRLPSLTRR